MENFESLINNYVSSELKDENYFHPLGRYYIANKNYIMAITGIMKVATL